ESRLAGRGQALGTVAFPEMRRGRVAVCFATLLARATGHTSPHIDYGSPEQAFCVARGPLAYYRALGRAGHVRLITNTNELNAHLAEWGHWEAAGAEGSGADTPPLGFVILMEGADPILDPGQVGDWQAAGLRILGLTHYGVGRYAGGTGSEVGLAEA